MKKLVITVWMLMSTSLLIAGGNFSPKLSAVAEIPAKSCKADKVYVEKAAELMWQDQEYTDAEDGAQKQGYSSGKTGTWKHAENYCRSLDYAGYTDWELPTSDELQQVHRLVGQVFVYFRGNDFWTSTPASRGKYYVVYPADAYRYENKMKITNYIRCVRCLNEDEK